MALWDELPYYVTPGGSYAVTVSQRIEGEVAKKSAATPSTSGDEGEPKETTDTVRLFLTDKTKLDALSALRQDKSVAVTFRFLLTEILDAALLAAMGDQTALIQKRPGS